jgi:hypothetical protein
MMKRISNIKTFATSDEAPKLTQVKFDRAKFRVSGKAVSKREWQDAVRLQAATYRSKLLITLCKLST